MVAVLEMVIKYAIIYDIIYNLTSYKMLSLSKKYLASRQNAIYFTSVEDNLYTIGLNVYNERPTTVVIRNVDEETTSYLRVPEETKSFEFVSNNAEVFTFKFETSDGKSSIVWINVFDGEIGRYNVDIHVDEVYLFGSDTYLTSNDGAIKWDKNGVITLVDDVDKLSSTFYNDKFGKITVEGDEDYEMFDSKGNNISGTFSDYAATVGNLPGSYFSKRVFDDGVLAVLNLDSRVSLIHLSKNKSERSTYTLFFDDEEDHGLLRIISISETLYDRYVWLQDRIFVYKLHVKKLVRQAKSARSVR